jgi:hypothetical protein
LGSYSAQSVTRVPPIGTGTYQVPGSYYGNSGAPANAAAQVMSASEGMTAASIGSAGVPGTTPANFPTNMSQVSAADYTTTPDAEFSVPSVTTASGTANTNLQWRP